ncbi:MAG: hypothetical protein AMXMBFR84_31470 [Candidatus Hydrogenedentota bacterium]
MKIDLHCHSKFSKRPTLWIMQKLGCPESFTEPVDLYRSCLTKGMSAVTITDHNVIDGALEIAHLPNTITGCEYTTYFPEDRCKVHILVYGMTESQHRELTEARENIFDLVAYVHDHNLPHICAHPLFWVNDRLTVAHVEKLVLFFKNWEINGDMEPAMNSAVQYLVQGLTPEIIERLVNKHGIVPKFDEPWKKNLTAGSDDHSSLNLTSAWTEVPNAGTFEEFWRGLNEGHARIGCFPSSPEKFSRNVYGIAYQFYKSKFSLDRHVHKDVFLRYLDRSLQSLPEPPEPWFSRFQQFIASQRLRKGAQNRQSILNLARHEAEKHIKNDPQLMDIVQKGIRHGGRPDETWYEFVNQVSNKVLVHFGRHVVDRIVRAQLFDLFHSLGSAGALYMLLAPYFIGYSLYRRQRTWSEEVLTHFRGKQTGAMNSQPRVAHFTDTYHEVNGVARTLKQQNATAQQLGLDYTIVSSFAERRPIERGVHPFTPIGTITIPEYPELKMLMPPFLEMLKHCYDENFTHIHVATPGPVGLAALGIARILQLPISGTYHTAFPQYAKVLTDDGVVEEMMWKAMIWFYDQLDAVYVPSMATGNDLVERGLNPDKLRVYPRGVDIERFHPRTGNESTRARFGIPVDVPAFIYVGRVSREKNLHILAHAYNSLLERGVEATLVIVGDGPFRLDMQKMLEGSPAVFTGYLEGDDLPAIYAACDTLVFPSTTDTFGNVVLEAQACGIPAIVTDQGGPQENVVPDETGIVVRGTEPAALVEAMALLANDRALRLRMGAASRRYIENRGFARAFEQLYAMYVQDSAQTHTLPLVSLQNLPFPTSEALAI